jgi:circadian clock protein KaiC
MSRVTTGIDGLDEVVHGGLVADRGYMVTGPAGAGKTILCLHFLAAGVERGESTLFVNLEQDPDDLRTDAAALGLPIESVEFLDLSPSAAVFTDDESYDVFTAAAVESDDVTDRLVEAVDRVDPDRVVVDPLTQLRYLTSDEYQFRKQVVGLMRYLTGGGATVLFTTQATAATPTEELQFITDGTIRLSDADRGRRIAVPKLRGSGTLAGEHAYRITDDGMTVFPALVPSVATGDEADTGAGADAHGGTLSAGVDEVDALLGGGFERGAVNLISGPTGVGKTTLGTQFASEAAARGERTAVYLFEESRDTFMRRSRAVGIPVDEMVETGRLRVEEVEGLDVSPQEFAARVRDQVEREGTGIVMIDGVAGYRITAAGDEDAVVKRLHALGRYLKHQGVTTILVDETTTVTGDFRATDENISYLADSVVFLRHVEFGGELRKVIGVLKKRTGDFERTLRTFEITGDGLRVGEPLTRLRGVLTGTPELLAEGRDAVEED